MILLYGVAIAAAILSLVWGITARPPAARANLMAGLDIQEPTKSHTGLTRSLGQGLRRFLPSSYLKSMDTMLVQAGHPYRLDLSKFLGFKLVLFAATLVVSFLVGYPLFGVAVALGVFFLPDYWLAAQREARQAAIQNAAADTIDQLTLVVEAGLGFDAALQRVASTNEGPLAVELQRTVDDIRAGVPRDQALRAFADRTRLPDIQRLVTALIQAQKYGVTIAETLRIQSAELRDKRMQGVEEKAAKLATKMIFPTMLCFMPVCIIVLVAPSFIETFNLFPSH
jgi:tight adherence protein C